MGFLKRFIKAVNNKFGLKRIIDSIDDHSMGQVGRVGGGLSDIPQ